MKSTVFHSSLVLGVHQWILVLTAIRKRWKNFSLWLNFTVALVLRSHKTRHPAYRQLSLTNISYRILFMQSAICQYDIVDSCSSILHARRFQVGSFDWLRLRDFSTKSNNRITGRNCSFSIYLELVNMSVKTRLQHRHFVCENILHCSRFPLQYWRYYVVRLNTYRAALMYAKHRNEALMNAGHPISESLLWHEFR